MPDAPYIHFIVVTGNECLSKGGRGKHHLDMPLASLQAATWNEVMAASQPNLVQSIATHTNYQCVRVHVLEGRGSNAGLSETHKSLS